MGRKGRRGGFAGRFVGRGGGRGKEVEREETETHEEVLSEGIDNDLVQKADEYCSEKELDLVDRELNETILENLETDIKVIGKNVQEVTSEKVFQQKSWVEVLGQNRIRSAESGLKFVPPSVKDGRRVVRLPEEEVKLEAEKWRGALIGSVLGELPSFRRIESFALNRWKRYGLISVHMVKPNVFSFIFGDTVGRDSVLENGPYTFNRKPLILREWSERMEYTVESLRRVPVWVKLPGLAWEFWGLETLSRIGSICGRPLYVDQCTLSRSRLGYARMLVEMDIQDEFPNSVVLEDVGGIEYVQSIEYECKPVKCKECGKIGHDLKVCRQSRRETIHLDQANERKEVENVVLNETIVSTEKTEINSSPNTKVVNDNTCYVQEFVQGGTSKGTSSEEWITVVNGRHKKETIRNEIAQSKAGGITLNGKGRGDCKTPDRGKC